MFLKSIHLQNLLSFGPESPALEMGPLNVLIGPNGSGKSNLIEAISLLQAAPTDLAAPIRAGGGFNEWLWKGNPEWVSRIEARVALPDVADLVSHQLSISRTGDYFQILGESVDARDPHGEVIHWELFEHTGPIAWIWSHTENSRILISPETLAQRSVLSQRKDPIQYTAITMLADLYAKIRIHREWQFGRLAPLRQPQRADEPNDVLADDCRNLAMVFNRLEGTPEAKDRIVSELNRFLPGAAGYRISVFSGQVQLLVREGRWEVPLTRLSDGTLRYLCLLAILCDPTPPPLICIEEPELGLHPDILPTIAGLLREASTRTQLIVTTHSDILIDCFTEEPEAVVVCEKVDGSTTMKRLEQDRLKEWLKEYSLGQLWSKGVLGGNRW